MPLLLILISSSIIICYMISFTRFFLSLLCLYVLFILLFSFLLTITPYHYHQHHNNNKNQKKQQSKLRRQKQQKQKHRWMMMLLLLFLFGMMLMLMLMLMMMMINVMKMMIPNTMKRYSSSSSSSSVTMNGHYHHYVNSFVLVVPYHYQLQSQQQQQMIASSSISSSSSSLLSSYITKTISNTHSHRHYNPHYKQGSSIISTHRSLLLLSLLRNSKCCDNNNIDQDNKEVIDWDNNTNTNINNIKRDDILWEDRIQMIGMEFMNQSISDIQKKLALRGIQLNKIKNQQQHPSLSMVSYQNEQQQQQQQQFITNTTTTSITDHNNMTTITSSSNYDKVLGCTSNVYIQTTILLLQNSSDNDNNHNNDHIRNMIVHIDGIADSIISRGMLSCMIDIMNGLYVHDVLDHIGSTTLRNKFVDDIYLRTALSTGRNDGISNMLYTIYQQLITLLVPYQNSTSLLSSYQSTIASSIQLSSSSSQPSQKKEKQDGVSESSLLSPTFMTSSSRNNNVVIIDTTNTTNNTLFSRRRPFINYNNINNRNETIHNGKILSSQPTIMTTATTTSTTTSTSDGTMITTPEVIRQQQQSIPTIHINKNSNNNKNVALLLSGGVDSSVALHLLIQQGYNVTAYYIKIWLEDEISYLNQCPWEDDYITCQNVIQHAEQLYNGITIPFYTISLQEQYHDNIIQYMINESKYGRTPNPDILCNSRIKFGCFYDAVFNNIDNKNNNNYPKYDYIATGHYAQLIHNNDNDNNIHNNTDVRLIRSIDPIKDQSYFLCQLTQEQLKHCIFPIGSYNKKDIRDIACNVLQLPNYNRIDSQGLCFLGKMKFDEFLYNYLGKHPGNIIDIYNGNLIGQHNGIWYHTIGQRKGLGQYLYPTMTSIGPWYVVAKDTSNHIIYCTNRFHNNNENNDHDDDNDDDNNMALLLNQSRRQVCVDNIHWISGHPPSSSLLLSSSSSNDDTNECTYRLKMKVRHGPKLVSGSLTLLPNNNNDNDKINNNDNKNIEEIRTTTNMMIGHVQLDEIDGGLAPGQFIAFYDSNDMNAECYGCGVITDKYNIQSSLLSSLLQKQKHQQLQQQ